MGFLFRRDAYVTLIALVLAANLPRVAAGGLLVGDLILAGMLLVHHLVLFLRRRAQPAA